MPGAAPKIKTEHLVELQQLLCESELRCLMAVDKGTLPLLVDSLATTESYEGMKAAIFALQCISHHPDLDVLGKMLATNVVPELVAILSRGAGCPEGSLICWAAAGIVQRLSLAPNAQGILAMVEAGVIPPLIGLVRSPPEVHEATASAAAVALTHLCVDPDSQIEIAAVGLPMLVKVLKAGGGGAAGEEELLAAVAQLVGNLSLHPYNKGKMVNAGAIVPLVKLLESKSPKVVETTMKALANLGVGGLSQEARAQVAGAGTLHTLYKLLGSGDKDLEYRATWALAELSGNTGVRFEITAVPGILPLLLGLLDSKEAKTSKTRDLVAGAVFHLCEDADVRGLIASSSSLQAVARLIKLLLASKTPDGRGNATVALTRLITGPDSRLAIGGAVGVTPRLIELLESDSEVLQVSAAALLNKLAEDCPVNRAKILEAGALGPLKSLMMSSSSESVRDSARMAVQRLQFLV